MKITVEALGDLMDYERITGVHPLDSPKMEKGDIPKFIQCPAFVRAQQRAERSMERYETRVTQLKERLQESSAQIDSLDKDLEQWSSRLGQGVGWIDRQGDDAEKFNRNVARHNDAVDQVRRIRERREDAANRHNDLVGQHKDAVEEAREKLGELTDEALSEIDRDIVACLDKCMVTATRLSEREDSDHLTAALETCFLGLKAYHVFEEHIDSNAERQEARKKIAEINDLFLELSGNLDVRNTLAGLYRSNSRVVEKNSALYSQIVQALEGVDQRELDSMTQSIQETLGERVGTSFRYEGVIDPIELGAIVDQMHKAIDAIETNMTTANELFGSTQEMTDIAVNTHQTVQTLLAAMKGNVEEVRDALLVTRHFACDMIDEAVIDSFYSRELRPIATGVRQFLVEQIGEEEIAALVAASDDRYLISGAEGAIEKSNLLRLQNQRERVDGHLSISSGSTQELRQHISRADEVPKRNAAQFRSSTSTLYALSWCPVFGFIPALMLNKKIESFAAAFRSNNQVYQELGSEIIAKNEKLRRINAKLVINYPASMILAQARKRLESYMGSSSRSQ